MSKCLLHSRHSHSIQDMTSITEDFLGPPRQKKIVLSLSRQIQDKNGQIKTNLPKIKICLEYENRCRDAPVYCLGPSWRSRHGALPGITVFRPADILLHLGGPRRTCVDTTVVSPVVAVMPVHFRPGASSSKHKTNKFPPQNMHLHILDSFELLLRLL